MIKYPNGPAPKTVENNLNYSTNHKNLGMTLEGEVTLSAKYFLDSHLAIFYKKPTPIHVFKVSPTNSHRITEAFYEKKSTTDYNGLYRGRYVDFECKETKIKSLPLDRLHEHQIQHLKLVKELGGIAFFMVRFTTLNETYLLDVEHVVQRIEEGTSKSFSYTFVKEHGTLIHSSYNPRLDIVKALDEAYFSDEEKVEIC